MCTILTALCCLTQVLLIITALVVAAAFTGLGIKWAEEWRSARISLQVSWLDQRLPCCPIMEARGDKIQNGAWASQHDCVL